MKISRMASMNRLALAAMTAVVLVVATGGSAWGQTWAPAAQTVPYMQTWGTTTFTSMPTGTAVFTGLNGTTVSTEALAQTSAPPTVSTSVTAATAPAVSGGTDPSGGSYGYMTSANARHYIQTGTSSTTGANQLAVAFDATGSTGIQVSYDIEVPNGQTRSAGVVMQYRLATTGAWTTVAGTNNPYTYTSSTGRGDRVRASVTLPPADGQAMVQLRWATWRGTEAGNSSGLAIDYIMVTNSTQRAVVAIAGLGGSVSPSGNVLVSSSGSQLFTFTPDAGYQVADVVVDGASVGASASYAVNNPTENHTILVTFVRTDPAQVGWWRMEENGGTTLVDWSGNARNGTISGTPSWVTGREGLFALNQTSSGYSTVPNASIPSMTNSITLAGWIRPAGPVATMDLIKKATNGGGAAGSGFELSLGTSSSSWQQKVFTRLNQGTSGDGYRINSTTPYPITGTTWMHTALTYDGATMRLYINGVQEASMSVSVPIATNTLALSIGAEASGGRRFHGSMDDAQIYDYALSPGDILALANPRTITATAGANGSISPSGAVTVYNGADQTFTITPNGGFVVEDVLVDGGSVGAVTSYPFTNVTANHTIDASFVSGTTYTLTYTAGPDGTISGPTPQVVSPGADGAPVTAVPNVSYTFVDWSDGVLTATRTETNVNADVSVTANFAINTYTLTYAAGAGGTISGTSPQSVSHGGSGTPVTAVPDVGYAFVDWSDGVLTATRTETNVMANLSVTANFALSSSGTIDAGPASGAVTLANPTATVPVRITRASGAPPILAFSVAFTVNEPQIVLPAGSNSITLPAGGGYLNAAGDRDLTLQTIDLGGGMYQADGTTLGSPCGSSALTGTLFNIAVSSAELSGTGTVTINSVSLRDCSNGTVGHTIGTAATVLVDRTAPTVSVTMPNGGETWYVGSSESITWTGSDPEGIASYDLAYSTDGGTTYPNAIATVPGTETSYAWTIPAAPGTQVRVRATGTDANGNTAADASDANFTIAYYTLTYTAGAGGTISGTSPQSVSHGGSGTPVTAVPDVGYAFVDWSDGVLTATRAETNVTADVSVTANFAIIPSGANALAFDGINRHVTFGASPQLNASDFTIELWFKKTGTGATTSSGSGGVVAVPLIAKGRGETDGGNLDINYFLGINAAGRLVADYEEGTGQISPGLNHPVVGSAVISDNVWYHGAAVFDGNSLRLYLNGELDGVTVGLAGRNPQSASIQHTTLATTTNSTGTPEGFFAGEIDEPRIWGVPRTQCEVIASMNAEVTSGTGLLGRWGLNEGVGMTAGNSVAGSPDGSLVNEPVWVPGAPFDLVPPVVPSPAAPSDLAAAAPDAQQVQLTWTDNATFEIGFEIERSTSGIGGPFALLTTVGPDVTAYVDAVLEAQTEYCYRVRALGCAGNSGYTAAECATTTAELCNALLFTPNGAGTNSYVTFGNPAALQLTQFTLELWVRRDGAGISTQSASGGIPDAIPLIAKGRSQNDTAENNVNYFFAIGQTNGVLAADFEEGPTGPNPGISHAISGVTPLATGVWYHAAATYDGATWKLYLNGNLDAQLVVNRPAADVSTVALALASALNGLNVPAGYFDGAIDEVRIWNYARTQAEIQATRLQTIVSPTPGLVARWGLDEAAGTAVYGTAGTGIHGTIVGSAGTDWNRVGCIFAVISVDTGPVSALELSPVAPNPIRGRAYFQLALPQAGQVRLEILDVQGRRLAILADGERSAGRHEVVWNGRSQSGAIANGVYFLRFSGLGREITRRFVVLTR